MNAGQPGAAAAAPGVACSILRAKKEWS